MSNRDILFTEMELLKKDIINVYNNSGKRVTGQFEKDLSNQITKSNTSVKVELFGNGVLSGRRRGKMPPIENLKQWVLNKGIFGSINDKQASSIAWAIAKTIAKRGTNKSYHKAIYDEVITAKRIDEIIQKVTSFNVSFFVGEITIEMQKLTRNI